MTNVLSSTFLLYGSFIISPKHVQPLIDIYPVMNLAFFLNIEIYFLSFFQMPTSTLTMYFNPYLKGFHFRMKIVLYQGVFMLITNEVGNPLKQYRSLHKYLLKLYLQTIKQYL